MGATATYWLAVGVCAAGGAAACVVARRRPGVVARWIGRAIAFVLATVAIVFVLRPVVDGPWSAGGSLPLALCDVALVVAAVSCWTPRWQFGAELTYFWGMAGTLQAVITPDLSVRFPHLEFFEFVLGHVAIVVAACYLVFGLRLAPRPGAVGRVFAVTVVYTAVVGVVDAALGANYMYLAHIPAHVSLLSVLGPWPWYIGSAAVIALALFWLLDVPFRALSWR